MNLKWKFFSLGLLSALGLGLLTGAGASGFVRQYAQDPGTTWTPGKVALMVFTGNRNSQSWCIANELASPDTARFLKLSSAAGGPTPVSMTQTSAQGTALAPGQSYCEPVGGEPIYGGPLSVIFQSTAGTKALDVIDTTAN